MKLKQAGESISQVEVSTITAQGIWLFVKDTEHFMPFDEYPWFREAKIDDILNVELLNDHHLRWEILDIDLELESLENPENYPLIYKN